MTPTGIVLGLSLTLPKIMPWLLTRGRTSALLVLVSMTLVMAVFASQLRVEQEPQSMGQLPQSSKGGSHL